MYGKNVLQQDLCTIGICCLFLAIWNSGK
uniref:Uncharacterized protein n=1 Tax=Anguilla anguilla TaxID=7936 RepID=A0A0E9P9Q2_ANGAN